MSLRLRRGTNAERLTITPLSGELIYTTDTKEVFIGDGTTLGGRPVTAFTNQQAEVVLREVLAESDLLVNNTHTGITFTYDNILGVITAEVTAVGSSTNSFTSILVPAQDPLVADSPTDFFTIVPGNGINIITDPVADTLSISTTALTNLVDDTSPSLGGNLNLNNFKIEGAGNIDINGTFKGAGFIGTLNGTVQGEVLGYVKGDVFADNSTLLVDGQNGKIVGPIETSNLVVDTGNLKIDVNPSIGAVVKCTNTGIYLATEGEALPGDSKSVIGIRGSRLSGSNYAPVQNGDTVGYLIFEGFNGNDFIRSAVIGSTLTSNVVGNSFSADMTVSVLNEDGLYRQFTFGADGFLRTDGIRVFAASEAELSAIASISQEGSIGYGVERKSLVFFDGTNYITTANMVGVPQTPVSDGKRGQIAADATHLYICYSTNNWIRVPKDGTWI